jgi:putative addiction module killer protein
MELEIYRNRNGNEPFLEWLSAIRNNKVTAARIRSRLRRIEESSNLGDHQSVGDGVFELRFQFGAGYRVYFGKIRNDTILLLRGGDKSSQRQDIARAKIDWQDHNSKESENA